jgi:two-component system response regulator
MSDELTQARPAEILLVEDNEDDVLLTRASFEQSKFKVNLHHVENGEQCMAFLHKKGPYADAPTPDLLLLDLNLPVMNGREVLAEIVKNEKLNHLPVIILTTSSDERDILAMYKLRCSAYVTKPVDFRKFQEIVQAIKTHWFTIVVLPPKD